MRELPEMEGGWDELFDESYALLCAPSFSEERARAEAEGAARLAGLSPGAEVLDCPCGFARHSLPLADAGYRVTGADRSAVQLAQAERRRGAAEWPWLVRADYRELPFDDESFDAVLCLFSSLGYLERAGDVGVLAEFRRVLRPGRTLIVETMHRDRLARVFRPRASEICSTCRCRGGPTASSRASRSGSRPPCWDASSTRLAQRSSGPSWWASGGPPGASAATVTRRTLASCGGRRGSICARHVKWRPVASARLLGSTRPYLWQTAAACPLSRLAIRLPSRDSWCRR